MKGGEGIRTSSEISPTKSSGPFCIAQKAQELAFYCARPMCEWRAKARKAEPQAGASPFAARSSEVHDGASPPLISFSPQLTKIIQRQSGAADVAGTS